MFKVRRFGISRRASRRILGVVLFGAAAFLVAAPSASADDQESDFTVGNFRPEVSQDRDPGDGPTGCTVTTSEGYVTRVTGDFLGVRTQSTVITEHTNEEFIGPPAPTAVDTDITPATGTPGSDISYQEIEDGEIELDGVPYNVYEVTGCDGYADGQTEIVFAPPTAAAYLPAVDQVLRTVLPVPELTLKPFDEENDWTYVQAPIDFRTDAASLAPVSFVLDSGGPDFVGGVRIRRWIAVEAVPSLVIFESGDPLAEETRVECSPEEALQPYVVETPGACSYQFRNSSSVTDSNLFDAELRVEWNVTFTRNDGPPGTIDVDPTINEEEIAVAEVKAVNVYNE